MKAFWALLLCCCALHVQAAADVPAALQQRYQALVSELRCLVCQNQSLADSDADLAQDMRAEVLKAMQAGTSDAQIVDLLVDRYGDFVRYRPPVNSSTWLLWFGPALLLLGGAAIVAILVRRRRRIAADDLSPAEHARARALLDGDANP